MSARCWPRAALPMPRPRRCAPGPTLPFAAEDEAALIALAPEAVGFVHEVRLDTLLWDGRSTEAERMLPRVPEDLQALARARLALAGAKARASPALIEAVPKARAERSGPGL